MVKPTPSNELINKFIDVIKDNGNSAGNKKIQDTLSLSDKDYTWVKDHLINQGLVVPGRGRGGSLRLVEQATVTAVPKPTAPEPAPEPAPAPEPEVVASPEDLLDEDLTITIDTIKSKYQRLKDDIKAFKTGMKVVRPMTDSLREEYAWRHMRTYMVTRTDDTNVYVVPHPNRKKEPELQALPKGFYVRH